jgi:hypothetical protein
MLSAISSTCINNCLFSIIVKKHYEENGVVILHEGIENHNVVEKIDFK